MSLVLNRQESLPVTDAPAGGPTPPGGRRASLLWGAAAAGTAGLGTIVRTGYAFGVGDHLVLMAKGISWADPEAYRNDWFVNKVGQPHWFFDVVTFLGERFGALPGVYLLWWIATLVVFGTAAVWLAERFLPGRPWMALLLGPLVAAGPLRLLGSVTPLSGMALPNVLGGCLGLLALAALLTGRWRAANLAALATGIIHMQHGADLIPVLVLVALLGRKLIPARHRRWMFATAAVLLLNSVAVVHLRQIESGGSEWLEVCRTASPAHCDANSWSWWVLATGAVAVLLALVLVAGRWRDWRTTVPTIALPAIGVIAAVFADRLDIPVFGRLAQQANVYRLASYVIPLAALGLLVLAVSVAARRQAAGLGMVLFFGATTLWLVGDLATMASRSLAEPIVLAGAALVALTGWRAARAQPGRHPGAITLLVPVVAVLAAIAAGQGSVGTVVVGYARQNPAVVAALEVGKHLSPGAVVAADPRFDKLRALSRRGVVTDCRNIPYGGAAWREHKERLAALGMRSCLHGEGGLAELSIPQLLDLRSRFGVTHVLLAGNDPKLGYAKDHWLALLSVPPADWPVMYDGWWLFELPARA